MKKKEYCFRNLNTGEIDYVEVEITSSITASGQREKRQKPTPECMRRNNIRVRQKKIRHLIRANFQENDIYLTLTYKRGTRPETLGDVKKHVQRFIKKLRKQYKSRGYQLKYVGTLERGSKGGYHMHIVLNRIPDAETYMHKTWEHGHVRTQCLYQEGEFKDLGDYLGKDSSDRWQTTSRNLIKPEEHTKEVKDNGKLLESPPERRKGFEIVKDSVYSGINPLTGRAYLKYSQKKITGKQ
ncbi:MAG: hypothetical protein Q4B85_05590, partial [Lachnospiraceae bacterium]|nr:hypothetical protein [Lachnospiraceae bacterium]